EEALERVAALTPDVILMDIKMPIINGLEATRMLRESGSPSRVIILSLHQEFLAQAFEAGAGGYLTKDMKREELVSAIRRVNKGEVVVASDLLASPDLMRQALKSFRDTIQRTTQSTGPHSPAPQPAEAPAATVPSPMVAEEASLPNPAILPPAPAPAAPDVSKYVSPQTAIVGYPPSLQTSEPQVVDAPAAPRKVEVTPEIDPMREVPENPMQRMEYPATSLEPPKKREEEAELILPPPLDPSKLMLVSRKLQEQHRVEIMETSGSWEGGTWMRLILRRPVSLLEVLSEMPEVAQVWEPTARDGDYLAIARPRPEKSDEEGPAPQLLIVKLAADSVQLALISS
ncbi:MAG: response regulator transcription factor, partial [Chloroflexi bacterium]|nr:response regulator transcription factor [Chloroflexota bacterium]